MNRAECKKEARALLKGQLGMPIVSLILVGVVVTAVTTITLGIGAALVSSLATMAVYCVFINAYNNKKYEMDDLLIPFKKEVPNRIVLGLLKSIYLFLWSMLFVVPGVIKYYSYYLSEIIALKEPDLDYNECISKSRKLMDGHKWEMFVFELSFILWDLLSLITLGFASLYVTPYMIQAKMIYIDKNIYPLFDEKEDVIEVLDPIE